MSDLHGKNPKKTDQFKEFLPQSPPRKSMRNPQRLTEIKCKTNRMKNSALPYLVHLVNSKQFSLTFVSLSSVLSPPPPGAKALLLNFYPPPPPLLLICFFFLVQSNLLELISSLVIMFLKPISHTL